MASLLLVIQRMSGLTLCSNYRLTMTYSIHYPMITWFTNISIFLQNSTKLHLYLLSSSVYDVPPGESYDVCPLFPPEELHVLCLLFPSLELHVLRLLFPIRELCVLHLWFSTLLMVAQESHLFPVPQEDHHCL